MVSPPWPSAVTKTESNPPLTTIWHAPESCTWTYDPNHTDTDAVAWLDLKPRPSDADATTLSCYPEGMFDGEVWGVFSPASCPRGWTTVDVSSETGRPPDEALTTATCCSSNYVYQDGYCGRKIPYVIAVPITYITVDSTVTYSILTESTTILENATIAVHTILAEWQAADATSIAGLTPDNDGDDDFDGGLDGNGLSSGGLSADAKAGIGVGVALALFLIGAIVFLIFRRRRGSTKTGGHEMDDVVYRGGSERSSGVGGRTRGSGDGSMRQHRGQPSSAASATIAGSPSPSSPTRTNPNQRTSVVANSSTNARSLEAGPSPGGNIECREVSPTTGRPIHRDAEIIVLREHQKAIQRRIEALQASDKIGAQ